MLHARRFLLVTILAATASAQSAGKTAASLDAATQQKITELAKKFWKDRPRTAFDAWDATKRAAIDAEAKAIALPEGGLDAAVKLLWTPSAKLGPRLEEPDKPRIATPYGDARLILKSQKGKNKGLVIGLHGGGEGAGDAGEAAGSWMLPDCVGMYPQGIKLVDDTWNTVHGERFILTLIEIAKCQFQVNPERIYVMGFSMGGTGSWFMAGRHPDLFAGASPCAGVFMAQPKSQLATKEEVQALQHGLIPNVRNLAMYYYIGLADTNCMPGTFLAAWDRLEGLMKADADGYRNIHFKSYPGLPHAFPKGEPESGLKFIAAQTRQTFPKTLVWEYADAPAPLPDADDKTTRMQMKLFYWLRCEKPTDNQKLRATLADNVVTLEGTLSATDFAGVSILLNPKMIDVKKEVVVMAGGKELRRASPKPDLATVLEALDARLDTAMVFDRRIDL